MKGKMTDTEFHIGNMILNELKRQERTKAWLAKKINCDPSNLNRTLQKQYIDMDLLRRISIALDHNFGEEFTEKISIDTKNYKIKNNIHVGGGQIIDFQLLTSKNKYLLTI